MQSYGYIYLTTNSINSIGYVGQRRGAFKPSYRGSGKLILRALKKHGRSCFTTEVIEWCDCQEELDQAEMDHISILRAFGADLYNLHRGGKGNHFPANYVHHFLGKKLSAEHVEKMRRAKIGKKQTDEHKRKVVLARSGYRHSPETILKFKSRVFSEECRKKLSIASTGRKLTPENKAKLIAGMRAHVWTEEERAKLRAASHHRPMSEENKRKLVEATKRRVFSPEAIAKMRAAKLGKTWDQIRKKSHGLVPQLNTNV